MTDAPRQSTPRFTVRDEEADAWLEALKRRPVKTEADMLLIEVLEQARATRH